MDTDDKQQQDKPAATWGEQDAKWGEGTYPATVGSPTRTVGSGGTVGTPTIDEPADEPPEAA